MIDNNDYETLKILLHEDKFDQINEVIPLLIKKEDTQEIVLQEILRSDWSLIANITCKHNKSSVNHVILSNNLDDIYKM